MGATDFPERLLLIPFLGVGFLRDRPIVFSSAKESFSESDCGLYASASLGNRRFRLTFFPLIVDCCVVLPFSVLAPYLGLGLGGFLSVSNASSSSLKWLGDEIGVIDSSSDLLAFFVTDIEVDVEPALEMGALDDEGDLIDVRGVLRADVSVLPDLEGFLLKVDLSERLFFSCVFRIVGSSPGAGR